MTLRKRLGYLKWILLDGGWSDARYERRLASLDRKLGRELGKLEAVATDPTGDAHVIMMCGHRQVNMGVLSLWSLARFLPNGFRFSVFSDGTVTSSDEAVFKRAVPNVSFIGDTEIEPIRLSRVDAVRFPKLNLARRRRTLVRRLIDFHFTSDCKKIVIIDSDVLFFELPQQLVEAAKSSERDMRWMHDMEHTYPASLTEMRLTCGVSIPEMLNSGVVVMPRLGSSDFESMERILERWPEEWFEGYFIDQTLMACLAGTLGGSSLDTKYYAIPNGAPSPYLKCVHYVSNRAIRPQFYEKGLPAVLAGRKATR